MKILNKLQPQENIQIIGEITALMMKSPIHEKFLIKDIKDFVVPPISCNQFRIYKNSKDMPVGYVSWALVSDELEHKMLHEKYCLKHNEWQTGKNLVFIDFIAPFGHAKKIIKDLRTKIFPNKTGCYLRFDDIGKCRKIVFIHGIKSKETKK